MLKGLIGLMVCFLPLSALAETGAIEGHSYLGGTKAVTSGLSSTNYLNGIIPSATITVYLTGTQTLATIYSDANNTPLGNPFTSNAASSVNPGGFLFWASKTQGYDIVLSGGIAPNTYPAPVTITAIFPSGGGTLGNLIPETTPFTVVPGNSSGYAQWGSAAVATLPPYANSTLIPFRCVGTGAVCVLNSGVSNIIDECTFNPNSPVLVSSFTYSSSQNVGAWSNGTNWEVSCPSVSASLTPIYVTSFGAVGDATATSGTGTDNCTAIRNAFDAGYATGRAVYFPSNPASTGGTFYYTSCAINPKGVSFYGPPGSGGQSVSSPGNMLVGIRGAPGKDVFAVPDPGAGAPALLSKGFAVRDIGIIVDATTDASSSGTDSFPNRLPGRTCFDGVANGTDVITSAVQCQFEPGDVGQAISMNGTTTTIASFQSVNQVTLATTVTSGTGLTAYISVAGLSATQTVGNCAFAMDASGLAGGYGNGPLGADFDHVVITYNGAATNYTCGYFFQGNTAPYQTKWDHDFLNAGEFGFVFAMPNTAAGQAGGYTAQGIADFNEIDNTWIYATYPWISYGGNSNSIQKMEISNAIYGPQILTGNGESGASYTTIPSAWYIDIPEMEGTQSCPGGDAPTTFRLTGRQHVIERLATIYCATGTQPNFQWDASGSTVDSLDLAGVGTFAITGNLNTFYNPFYPVATPTTYAITGAGNILNTCSASNESFGQAPGRCQYARSGTTTFGPAQLSRGSVVFNRTHDFIEKGAAAYYFNDEDLWFWPTEVMDAYEAVPTVNDSGSVTGTAISLSGSAINYLVGSDGAYWVLGSQIPATMLRFYVMAKASTSLSWTASIQSSSGAICSISPTLTTSYTLYQCDGDASSYGGTNATISLGQAGSGKTVSVAWIGIRPWLSDLEVNGPMQATQVTDTGLVNQNYVGTDSNGKLIAGGILGGSSFVLLSASLASSLAAQNQYFGVAAMPVASTAVQLTVVGEGTESCTSPPQIAVFDCGTAGTACGSPSSLGNVTMSATSGTSVTGTLSAAIAAGHEIRFFIQNAFTCATAPTIYATVTGHS